MSIDQKKKYDVIQKQESTNSSDESKVMKKTLLGSWYSEFETMAENSSRLRICSSGFQKVEGQKEAKIGIGIQSLGLDFWALCSMYVSKCTHTLDTDSRILTEKVHMSKYVGWLDAEATSFFVYFSGKNNNNRSP